MSVESVFNEQWILICVIDWRFQGLTESKVSELHRLSETMAENRAHAMMRRRLFAEWRKALGNQYARRQNVCADSLAKEVRTRYIVFFHVNEKWPVKIVPPNNLCWPKFCLNIWQFDNKKAASKKKKKKTTKKLS